RRRRGRALRLRGVRGRRPAAARRPRRSHPAAPASAVGRARAAVECDVPPLSRARGTRCPALPCPWRPRPPAVGARRCPLALLREALAGLLPDVARLRTEKADFRSLIEDSLAGPERSVIASLVLAPEARIRPYISERVVADAVDKVGDPKFIPYQGGLLRMVT